MNVKRVQTRLLPGASRIAWSILILALVFTSLPIVAALVQTNTVAAPAVLAALLLFVIWLLPGVLRGKKLPFLTVPFLAAVSILLVSTGLSFSLPILPVKGHTPFSEILDALITLAAAVVVYLVAASYPNTSARIKRSLQLVNLGGLLVILWSLAQAVFIFAMQGEFPEWMHTLQSSFSIRRLFHNRATGFAFEPSWLAHQLNMVYLPYWLAATLRNFSAHARRLGRLSMENLLLVGGGMVLLSSFSRVGWLAFFAAVTYALLHLVYRFSLRLEGKWFSGRNRGKGIRTAVRVAVISIFLVLYTAAGLGALEIAGRFDPRLDRLFDRAADSPTIWRFTNRLAFAERAVSWATGWEIFNDHPLFGVGLGNAGLFFNEEMPSFGMLLTEIRDIYFRRPFLFNTKSIWMRLLAEGGIFGFVFFATWISLLWKSARTMLKNRDAQTAVLGWTGVFFLVELVFEGFSIDSFALPYIWFTAGLVTAGAHRLMTAREPQGDGPGSTGSAPSVHPDHESNSQ